MFSKMLIWTNRSVFLVIVVLTFATANDNRNDMPEQALVEILISDYFKVEQSLWATIQNRGDNALLQVFNTHERFLGKTLSETDVGIVNKLVRYKSTLSISENANAINETVEMGYTHLRDKDLERGIITEFASSSLHILGNIDGFYDSISKPEFWQNIEDEPVTRVSDSDIVLSKHQNVFDFYREFQAILLKSYITIQMSYMIMHYYEGGNNRNDSIKFRSQFQQRTARIRELAKIYIQGTNREVWMQEPVVYNKVESYTQITNFLRGFIDNEANLNKEGSCTATCPDYKQTAHFHCAPGSFCAETKDVPVCNGIVRSCEEIDDPEIFVCQNDRNSIRYVKYSDGRMMGRDTIPSCSANFRATSWRRWFVKCSNCICTCDDHPSSFSDRYFSLRAAVSDISENKIVTGVQLYKQNRIIRWVINERVLLPFAQTKKYNLETFFSSWKSDQNEFKITDSDVEENVDYHVLSYEKRAINLDYVTAPRGHAVTGVRFRVVNGHISVEIRATEFDFCTGQLKNHDKSMWVANSELVRDKITVEKPDSPVRANADPEGQRIRHSSGFVEFGPTDFWASVGQLTVPFIDTQKLEPERPVVLSGIGLHLRGARTGSGGFIAPRLFVYDFEPYVKSD